MPATGARLVGALWVCAALALACAPCARAQTEASMRLTAQIAPQPLFQALENLSHQSGLQFVYLSALAADQRTKGVAAGVEAKEAVAQLLEGTGLGFQFLNDRTVRILPAEAAQQPIEEIVITAGRFISPPDRALLPTPEERRRLEVANAEIERRISRGRLLYDHPELDAYLQGVADRLLATDGTDSTPVRVRVLKGTDASAFALSNGSIYVTTALLASLNSEAEVAAILGHELTHYTNAHVLLGLRQGDRRSAVVWSAGYLFGFMLGLAEKRAGAASNQPLQLPEGTLRVWARASITGYPHQLEREADDTAVRRMIAAGYDAGGAVAALQHLSEQVPTEPRQQAIDATHTGKSHEARTDRPLPYYASSPQLSLRMMSYRELLAGKLAGAVAAGRDLGRAGYTAQVSGLRLDQVAMFLQVGALDRADATLDSVVAVADSPRAEFLRGEIARNRSPSTDANAALALAAYQRAVEPPEPVAEAFREQGYLYWRQGNFPAARAAFESYLTRAPQAADAPMIRWYLEQERPSAAGAPH